MHVFVFMTQRTIKPEMMESLLIKKICQFQLFFFTQLVLFNTSFTGLSSANCSCIMLEVQIGLKEAKTFFKAAEVYTDS